MREIKVINRINNTGTSFIVDYNNSINKYKVIGRNTHKYLRYINVTLYGIKVIKRFKHEK